ncbi:hypothetical protein PSPO01_09891 [Paraphaeosphaeria sporulosa]
MAGGAPATRDQLRTSLGREGAPSPHSPGKRRRAACGCTAAPATNQRPPPVQLTTTTATRPQASQQALLSLRRRPTVSDGILTIAAQLPTAQDMPGTVRLAPQGWGALIAACVQPPSPPGPSMSTAGNGCFFCVPPPWDASL